jgi:hypothetical protein
MKTISSILAGLIVGNVLGPFLLVVMRKPIEPVTFYLPDAAQGSQPFCLSNRSKSDIQIPSGPVILPGQTVNASVTHDYEWGFSNPVPSTDRGDVDCFVVGR